MLREALLILYPNAQLGADYTLVQEANDPAPRIDYWNPTLGPRPTQADLERGFFEYTKWKKLRELAVRFDQAIAAIYPMARPLPDAFGEEALIQVHHTLVSIDIDDNVVATRDQRRAAKNNYVAKRDAVNALKYATNTVAQINAINW